MKKQEWKRCLRKRDTQHYEKYEKERRNVKKYYQRKKENGQNLAYKNQRIENGSYPK